MTCNVVTVTMTKFIMAVDRTRIMNQLKQVRVACTLESMKIMCWKALEQSGFVDEADECIEDTVIDDDRQQRFWYLLCRYKYTV